MATKKKAITNECGFVRYIEHFRNEPYAQVCNLTINHRGVVSTKADELE